MRGQGVVAGRVQQVRRPRHHHIRIEIDLRGRQDQVAGDDAAHRSTLRHPSPASSTSFGGAIGTSPVRILRPGSDRRTAACDTALVTMCSIIIAERAGP
jgi:hypothetical protein